MRDLAAMTEAHVHERLVSLVAERRPVLEAVLAELRDAVTAARVEDDHLREMLADWPTMAARGSWWSHWRARRRMTSMLRRLQFAIRRYEHGSIRLVRAAAALARAADGVIAHERSYAVAYDPTRRFAVVEPNGLIQARRWAVGTLPVDLRLVIHRAGPARVAPA